MAKWVAQIDRADRIPEYLARAYATACSGRPGPVVLALPEDMLAARERRLRRTSVRRRAPPPGSCGRRGAPRPARAGRAAARNHRRRGLDAPGNRGPDAVPRGERASGGRGVPAAGRARQRLAELCRGRRHRHQPGARGAREGGGSPARDRAPPRGDDDLGLHARRVTGAEADTRPRASGRGGARPRLPRGAPDPGGAGGVRGGRPRAPGRAALARLDRRRTRRLRGLAGARAAARRARPRRVHRAPPRAPAGRDRHERRRQLHRLGAPLLALAPLRHASSRRRAGRWATACRRRSPRRRSTRTGRWSASPATATS